MHTLLTVYSAGIGRTGTFIALDALYEHGQERGYVDIMEYVQRMRKEHEGKWTKQKQATSLN
jgi:protein tyrosine phosphatase